MKGVISIILFTALILFILGIVMILMTMKFVKRKEHTLLSIIFSILQCPCIYIPINITIGLKISKIILLLSITYGIVMIILSIKNMKQNIAK